MTVQRQYILPNCNLRLEGLSGGDETDPMAPLTVVLNTECTFPDIKETLSGGREFLDALVKAVNDYTQSILSGVAHPMQDDPPEAHPVTLHPGENHRHQLTAMTTAPDGDSTRKTLNLNTVQLFDLMEAVDQLLADTQTLPEMQLQLTPLHRRHARPDEPVTKRVIPAAAGMAALAASAAIFFVLPVPEVEPDRPREEENTEQIEEVPLDGNPESTAPPETDTETTDSNAVATDTAESELDTPAAADPVAAATALTRLSTAPAITDPDILTDLENQLETRLTEELSESPAFEDALVYRVAVSEDGDLLGYKYENDAALLNVDNTPLPDLTFTNLADQATEEPIAQFRLTFEPDGTVVAEPVEP